MSSKNSFQNRSTRGVKRKSKVLGEIDPNGCYLDNITPTSCSRPKKLKRAKDKLKQDIIIQREQLANELTPSSTISTPRCHGTLDFITPLPNLNFADARLVWKLMIKNEDLYKRDITLFNRHSSLQPIMRATLLDWLNEVCQAYELSRQTYYLALDFFDRYLSEVEEMPKKRLQLLGITCLFIAAKIEEIFPPKLHRFSFVCDGACDDDQILKKELVILDKLGWNLHPITPVAWLSAYVKIYSFSEKENISTTQVNESFLMPDQDLEDLFIRIAHLIDLCTLDAGSLVFPYSVIAASAFYHFTNENVVLQCTGKSLPELQTCVEWMVPFAIAIKNAGFGFVNKCISNRATFQTHTISLELLQNAQSIQADIENQKLATLESSDASSLCPMTPSKVEPLTLH